MAVRHFTEAVYVIRNDGDDPHPHIPRNTQLLEVRRAVLYGEPVVRLTGEKVNTSMPLWVARELFEILATLKVGGELDD